MTHCGMGSRGSDAGSKQGWECWGEGQGRLCVALQGDPAGQGRPLCGKESFPRLTQHPASSCKRGCCHWGPTFTQGNGPCCILALANLACTFPSFPTAMCPALPTYMALTSTPGVPNPPLSPMFLTLLIFLCNTKTFPGWQSLLPNNRWPL